MRFNLVSRHRCVPVLLLCALTTLPWATLQAGELHLQPRPSQRAEQLGAYPAEPAPVVATGTRLLSVRQLVRNVWQHNRGIDAMRAATAAASARIESAGALDDPTVSYAMAPNTAGGPRQGLNQNVQVSQSLPWPGTLDLRSKVAEAEAVSAGEQLADLRLRLAARARADYAQWYYVHQALAINARNRTLVRRLRKVAETSYASGQSPQQDVLQAEVELIRLDNQTLELKRMRRTVRAKINALQNLAPGTIVPAPAALPRQRVLPSYGALQDAALAHYPMLQSLDARVSASRRRVDLAHKANYPKLKLMAGYNSLMDLPAKRLVIGVGFSIPFGGNHRGQVSEANAHLQESEAKLADARNQLLSDLDQTHATAAQAAETIRLYTKRLLPLTALNLHAAEADYSNGTGDFLKLITAEQQDLKARLELAGARADFYTQLASLDYQTGGALWPSPVSATAQDANP
ncbi:MAG: TolC family protein [Rhodanobacter sp.]|nr:MAG: TolC family protein [Rhodanobacter sp.]